MKQLCIMAVFFFIGMNVSAQDSTYYINQNKLDSTSEIKRNKYVIKRAPILSKSLLDSSIIKYKRTHMYRPTRLGSSSPLYNTYVKNKYGAGSVTTNPNKGKNRFIPVPRPRVIKPAVADTIKAFTNE